MLKHTLYIGLNDKDSKQQEIDTLTAAYNGEVYNYTLYRNGEEVDSCGGFYGLDCFKYMFEQMPAEFTNSFTRQEAESLANWNF